MRIPRPCRLNFDSFRSVSSERGKSEATANSLHHGKSEAVLVGERVILRGAIVEAENLLGDVTVKVERLDGHIGATKSTLQETPEVLNAVRVNLAANVFLYVI